MRSTEMILKLITPILAVLLAVVFGGIIIVSIGKSPVEAYGYLFNGAFGSQSALATTLVKATPLIFTGIAAAFAYRCGVFNLGGEGQFVMGAIASITVATTLTKVISLPTPIIFTLSLLAGALIGGLWGVLPGWLKVKRGLNEIIVTILLNYVATFFMSFLVNGPLMEGNIPQSAAVADNLKIPMVSSSLPIHYGIFAALLIAMIVFYFLFNTSKGLQFRSVGLNQVSSKVFGINVNKYILFSFVISGALAGLGGSIEVHGNAYRLMPGFGAGFGFDGVAIALIGQLNPLGAVVAAIFYAALRTGANMMQIAAGIPTSVVGIIQALVIIFVIAGTAITNLPKIQSILHKIFKQE